MIYSYRGRDLVEGTKVKVYFNLHTHLFSVKDYETGLVLAHGNGILLENVQFKVSEAGRQRVLREKKKNVHAYVIGTFVGAVALQPEGSWVTPYYNPYKVKSFMVAGKEIRQANYAWLSDKKVYAK